MSRTVRDIAITGRAPGEVETCAVQWLDDNGFEIIERPSKGIPFRYRAAFVGAKIRPTAGSLVAIKRDLGLIVFQITTLKADNGAAFHGEFFVAGADLFWGREWPLGVRPKGLGGWPRATGYRAMTDLLERLGQMSKKPR